MDVALGSPLVNGLLVTEDILYLIVTLQLKIRRGFKTITIRLQYGLMHISAFKLKLVVNNDDDDDGGIKRNVN